MSTYAVSDLHGRYDVWRKIKDLLKEDDVLFVLGDCADRGPDGFKILQEVINDPQVIFIKGNHEDLMVNSLRDINRYQDEAWYDLHLWYRNGGFPTFEAWDEAGRDFSWIRKLDALPHCIEYQNAKGQIVWLSHSGHPPLVHSTTGQYVISERSAIWDRDHISMGWHGNDNLIVVHGHTPVTHLQKYAGEEIIVGKGCVWYCDNHKVDIDMASAFSGKAVLLNLDTWEEHIFFDFY